MLSILFKYLTIPFRDFFLILPSCLQTRLLLISCIGSVKPTPFWERNMIKILCKFLIFHLNSLNLCQCLLCYPFSSYVNSAADDFGHNLSKIENLYNWMDNQPMTKSGKHCGKRRNYSFWAISSFVTMFSKSCLLQRRQKASIWGKGLNWCDGFNLDSLPWNDLKTRVTSGIFSHL